MTVKRQYTLPYCNLVLEGLNANINDPLSPLTVLMNAECQLPGVTDTTLTGGREFLDSLVAAVSRYGQQLLSGVTRPRPTPGTAPPMVDVKPGDSNQHHLIVQQQPAGAPPIDTDALAPLDIVLTTVQFYDLMEAVDQLLADTQTLPDLTAQFQAISRRSVKPAEPVAKRAAPAAIGAAALAAAGLALFFVPPPEFEPSRPGEESNAPADTSRATPTGEPPLTTPEDELEDNPVALSEDEPEEEEANDADGNADGNTAGDANENSADLATGAGPNAEDEPDESEAAGTNPARSQTGGNASLPPLEDSITQGDRIRQLNDLLRGNLADRLEPLDNNTDLAYRVRLTANGDVVGYEPLDSTSARWVNDTPIPDLVSAFRGSPEQADFRVVLTENGVLQVSPWDGWP